MPRVDLEKSYDHTAVESRWYPYWEQNGFFVADARSSKPRFSMVIPPPNVTGSLHMGHALEHTLHDILARWRRMQGYNVLWLPGTDHASIAVHVLLEKELEREGLTRFDLGREEFLRRAWQWKEQSGNRIASQMRRLGDSCDWTRERFTMDAGLSRAVREAFVRLFEQGLIYRGEYMVNWCPRCRTAISDLEVVYEQVQGKLYYINYPIRGGNQSICVATTRPETMLGDAAVAIHPDDERCRSLAGKAAVIPVAKREIPIICDEFVDREFGTGAVKITPAHDPNDFQVAQRHDLPRLEIIGEDGRMTAAAGEFAGLDRFECRERLVERLYRQGYLVKVEDYQFNLGLCQRCRSAVEPRLSMQWFVKVGPLAEKAIAVVEEGNIRFVPESYTKVYFDWMRNIHDWCISRQLWWGHRIPVWYCKGCGLMVALRQDPTACPVCSSPELEQDPDILDTWFSSALWPFSTMGWPDDTEDLRAFYPTDLLITGPDILFFWVARMIMMGMHFMGREPFRVVHLHGIVRDAQRQKMSKTKGNVIDPLDIMERYGADAMRFTLAAMAVPGTDIPFSTDRMRGYSAFANKVWNAARFVLMRLPQEQAAAEPEEIDEVLAAGERPLYERWILSRLNRVAADLAGDLANFRFDRAANSIYSFFWHELCDWYLELVKPALNRNHPEYAASAKVLAHVMDWSLRLLHPFMPYLTEEIWQKLPHRGPSIAIAEFPKPRAGRWDEAAEKSMALLMELITRIRSARAGTGIEPGKRIPVAVKPADPSEAEIIRRHAGYIQMLARVSSVDLVESIPDDRFSVKGVAGATEFALLLDRIIDPALEKQRLGREVAKTRADVERLHWKLNNQEFIVRAPEQVVEETRRRYQELIETLEKLETSLRKLEEADAQ